MSSSNTGIGPECRRSNDIKWTEGFLYVVTTHILITTSFQRYTMMQGQRVKSTQANFWRGEEEETHTHWGECAKRGRRLSAQSSKVRSFFFLPEVATSWLDCFCTAKFELNFVTAGQSVLWKHRGCLRYLGTHHARLFITAASDETLIYSPAWSPDFNFPEKKSSPYTDVCQISINQSVNQATNQSLKVQSETLRGIFCYEVEHNNPPFVEACSLISL